MNAHGAKYDESETIPRQRPMPPSKVQAAVDVNALRAWLQEVRGRTSIGWQALEDEIRLGQPSTPWMSRQLLRKLTDKGEVPKRKYQTDGLATTWNHLCRKYPRWFPEELRGSHGPVEIVVAAPEGGSLIEPADAGDRLASALAQFFFESPEKRSPQLPESQELDYLVGSYVMYYPDQLLRARKYDVPPLVRATWLEFTTSSFGLNVRERQNWPAKPPYQWRHNQEHGGVTFPYWKYLIALMKGKEFTSFRCLVFTKFKASYDLSNPCYDELNGEILMADRDGPFPSVRFFCRRFDGQEPPHHGTMPYEALDKEVSNHIKSSDPSILGK